MCPGRAPLLIPVQRAIYRLFASYLKPQVII